MAFEAFDAGVEPGGLRDRNEVKILVCYLLRELRTPLSFDQLNEILQIDGLVNYFELAQSVRELLETGHIDLVKAEGGPWYKVTKLGAGTAALFERRLPFTVREKATRAAVRLLARVRREAENRVDITERPQGDFEVTCRILDNRDALMSISLLVPARGEALAIKKEFLADPLTVYRGMLALLTGDRSAFADGAAGGQDGEPPKGTVPGKDAIPPKGVVSTRDTAPSKGTVSPKDAIPSENSATHRDAIPPKDAAAPKNIPPKGTKPRKNKPQKPGDGGA